MRPDIAVRQILKQRIAQRLKVRPAGDYRLQDCLLEWSTTQCINPFQIGANDSYFITPSEALESSNCLAEQSVVARVYCALRSPRFAVEGRGGDQHEGYVISTPRLRADEVNE